MKLSGSLLAAPALLGLVAPVLAQPATAERVIPGYLSVTGCPSANLTPCFIPNVGGNATYPPGATPLLAPVTGTTSTTATLTGASNQYTYLCGIHVDSVGTGTFGTLTVGPLATGAGSGTITMQANVGTGGNAGVPAQNFTPCLVSAASNTSITFTAVASSATAIDVNIWGFRQ